MQVATFIIAVVAVLLSAMSLFWQVASFTLSGRRVSVQLRIAATHSATGHVMTTEAHERLDADETLIAQGYSPPVLNVLVRNTGRLPVTVENWGFETYVQPRATGVPGPSGAVVPGYDGPKVFFPVSDYTGPAFPYRLEHGESVTWSIPLAAARRMAGAVKATNPQLDTARCKVELGDGQVFESTTLFRL